MHLSGGCFVMNGKKDTVGELYKKVAQYDKVLKIFVFLNVVSALAESLTNFSFNEVLLVVEIISAVAVVIIRWLINYNFYYTAEKARIEYAMSDGYNVDLTLKKTDLAILVALDFRDSRLPIGCRDLRTTDVIATIAVNVGLVDPELQTVVHRLP